MKKGRKVIKYKNSLIVFLWQTIDINFQYIFNIEVATQQMLHNQSCLTGLFLLVLSL